MVARFGKLNILVNNAGLFLGKDIEAASLAEWQRHLPAAPALVSAPIASCAALSDFRSRQEWLIFMSR